MCVFFHFQGLLNDERNVSHFFSGIIPTVKKNNHYDTPKIYKNDAKKLLVNEQKNNMVLNDKVSGYSLNGDFFMHRKRTRGEITLLLIVFVF